MSTIGVLIQLKWSNPYTQPPNGMVLLAEIFRMATDPDCRKHPPEFKCLSSLGDGYGYYSTFVDEPLRELSIEALVSVRKKRINRRIQKKYPLFAEQFVAAEVAKNPEYYEGITRADLKEAKDEVMRQEAERLAYLQSKAGQVLIYGKSHSVRADEKRANGDELAEGEGG